MIEPYECEDPDYVRILVDPTHFEPEVSSSVSSFLLVIPESKEIILKGKKSTSGKGFVDVGRTPKRITSGP